MEKLFIELMNILTFGLLKKSNKPLIRDEKMVLYFFNSCPYCHVVINNLNKKGIMIEARDIKKNPQYNMELVQGGGQAVVPCMRIENEPGQYQWLYDSNQINSYINQKYS